IIIIVNLLFNKLLSQDRNPEWQFYKEISGIQILYKYTECIDLIYDKHYEYVLLQFINTTDVEMEFQWKREMWYDDKCLNCDSNSKEYIHSVILKPEETLFADCDTKDRGLKIFSKFLKFKARELTKFEITEIKVTPR
ncbi:MAG: hypothetical protein ABIJ97_05060, partial [Bacteroidota bacterium]